MLLGNMGRDDAIADRLKDHELHVIGKVENPGLIDKASGNFYKIDSLTNFDLISHIAQQVRPEMFVTNQDNTLAAGIVDVLKKLTANRQLPEMLIPCPDRNAAKIEWDKFNLREIINEINPSFNPTNFMCTNKAQVDEAFDFFELANTEVAIKPRNLASGRGVRVMGKNLADFADAKQYALDTINSPDHSGVEVQEKLEGYEFTLQILTDGSNMVLPPTTFDFPYREDNDLGPNTGGMGAFSMENGEVMPFMTEKDYQDAISLMSAVLRKLKDRGIDYKGVLYPTFFKTKSGLKIVEINARGGDPEMINTMDLLEDDVDLAKVMTDISTGELDPKSVRYKKLASTVIYLVSPDYGYTYAQDYEFNMNPDVIYELGCKIRYGSVEMIGHNRYRTVGGSRALAISRIDQTPSDGRLIIAKSINAGFDEDLPLHHRKDIGSKAHIDKMRN